MSLSFPEDRFQSLLDAVDRAIDTTPGPHYAAFDADGTLWAADLGEGLFQYQIEKKLVPLPPHPWEHYEQLKKTASHEIAFLWLAQINAGVPLSQVREWAHQAVRAMHPVPTFEFQKRLIDHLRGRKVRVFIVTASIKWAVEPGAQLFGLTFDDVIGIRTGVDSNGIVTDQQFGPITWRRGKVDGLLLETQGKSPLFASGNTEGDLALLESATHVRLTVASAQTGHLNFPTEQKLRAIAHERGWHSVP